MKNKFAFSLLELAVSMTIISLIAGIILASNSLYKQSNLRAVIKEIQVINNAIAIFKDRYGYLPGDFPNPPANWNAVSGDGNGALSISETSNSWHHLYFAGFINQSFSSTSGSTYNFYRSVYPSALYAFRNAYIFYYSSGINLLEFGLINPNVKYAASYSTLKPKDAYYIDIKIDDGIANYGLILSIDGDDVSSGQCSASFNNTSTSSINYNLATNTVACRLCYIGNPSFNN